MSETALQKATIPFDGRVQSGVEQPPQAHLEVLGMNLEPSLDQAAFIELLKDLTATARELTQGNPIPNFLAPEMVAVTANLTITCGFGERIFDFLGKPELKPEGLHDIPAFKLDQLQERWGQTDLVFQICCDDPGTLFAAGRLILAKCEGKATLQWMQKGFTYAYGSAPRGTTPRNPFGQVDGTVNPSTAEEFSEQVWLDGSGDQAYLDGSTIMVLRRIQNFLDPWELLDRPARERVIGRKLSDGGPLSGGGEFDEEDMDAVDEAGNFIIDRRSHLALSREHEDDGSDKLRRRAFAYDDAPEPGQSDLTNSGLVWISFQRNPDLQFTAIQKRLDMHDLLNKFISQIGSAVYWIVPGTSAETYWGQGLLEK